MIPQFQSITSWKIKQFNKLKIKKLILIPQIKWRLGQTFTKFPEKRDLHYKISQHRNSHTRNLLTHVNEWSKCACHCSDTVQIITPDLYNNLESPLYYQISQPTPPLNTHPSNNHPPKFPILHINFQLKNNI